MKLNLSYEALQELFDYAEKSGRTVEGLIQSFIADLTNTEGTNGSDERAAADSWYNRASIKENNIYTAVAYYFGDMDELIRQIDILNEFKNDCKNLTDDLNNTDDPKEMDDLMKELDDCYKEVESKKEAFQELKEVYERDNNGDFVQELTDLINRYKKLIDL